MIAASVEALAERLVRLLEAAVAAPERAIGRLDILCAAERHTILREWNDTARPIPSATLPELFAAQAARTPDAVAVVFEDERLTYGELDARANQLAHHLRSLGVGPEVVVGLCVERSLEMMVGLLGILKAGGAYLPLDPGYPPERLAFMLEDAARAGAGHPIARCANALPRIAATTVRWMPIGPRSRANPTTAPRNRLLPHNTAYVIYTSGSTGTPKGVVHRTSQASPILPRDQAYDSWLANDGHYSICASLRASMLRSSRNLCRLVAQRRRAGAHAARCNGRRQILASASIRTDVILCCISPRRCAMH